MASPEPFAPPDWSGDDPVSHLEKLRLYAERTIDGELAWYVAKKRGRSITSQRLRLMAVVLTVLGGNRENDPARPSSDSRSERTFRERNTGVDSRIPDESCSSREGP